jgi:predicted nucleic acid-binding protein
MVLIEVLDHVSSVGPQTKLRIAKWAKEVMLSFGVLVIPSSRELFESALELYRNRVDKDWSLTDCSSILLMQGLEITEALTTDHHFEQAGFTILLK